MGDSKEKEKQKRLERLFKDIMAENFPNLGKKTDIQIQEANKTQTMMS